MLRVLSEDDSVCVVRGPNDQNLVYMIFSAALQKRSRYYAFVDWASTPEGRYHLRKQDSRGRWWPIELRSESGSFVIPHQAKTVLKNYCDHTFGGMSGSTS